MLYTLISLLIFFWILGLVGRIGGPFIHGLLVIALCIYIYKFLTGRGTSV